MEPLTSAEQHSERQVHPIRLWIFAAVFVVAALFLAAFSYRDFKLAAESKDWPTTTGTVTASWDDMERSGSNKGSTYHPHVEYSYVVESTSYQGDTIHAGNRAYKSASAARQKAAQYPVGAQVVVHYDPDNPKRAVLEPGVNKGRWILVLVTGVFVVTAIFAVRYAWRESRRYGSPLPAAHIAGM